MYMEDFKSTLFGVIIFLILGLVGYWAVASLQSGPEHLASRGEKQLQEKSEEFKDLNNEPVLDAVDTVPEVVKEEPKPVVEKPKEELAQPTKYKNQALIDELQKLVDGNIFMKLKSVGTRVGTVQKFLNLYNDTSLRIDNDYGETMKKAIIAFQKANGLTADGEAGPTTFKKMIDWLKKQG